MPPAETSSAHPAVRELLAQRDYVRLKARLGGLTLEDLRREWAGLEPLQKLAVFKLLGPDAAMRLFAQLGFDDKYLVFSGFEPGSVAPLTEDLSPARRSIFEKLGPDAYREMLRRLNAAAA